MSNPVEIAAVAFGVICVWLTTRQNIWCWPTGLIQVILYVDIFYRARLYSDVLLQVVYIGLQLYGWWHWLHGGKDAAPLPVARLSRLSLGGWVVAGLVAAAALGTAMHRYTDAAFPYLDAGITTMSLVAQYLLARKLLENWLFWIAVDLIAIGVYFAKGLYLTSGLYCVFLILATLGYFAWKRTAPLPAPAAA